MKVAHDFKVFAKPLLWPFMARWRDGIFTMTRNGKAVMVLRPDDARDLIDALQKFTYDSETEATNAG